MGTYDGSIRIDTRIDSSGFNTGIAKIMSSLKGMAVAAGLAFGVKAIVDFGRKAVSLASDLNEVQNVVDTVFGSASENIDEFAKNAIEQFGLSELAAKQYASTMGAMLKSMGMNKGQVTEMSKEITGLAGDMASFYNLDASDAFGKLRSGISGETEPLKQLGINLSQVNLETFAMSEGMGKAYTKMSEAEKALTRYNYILSVTGDAQGDFAKTSESWANQTRILTMQWEEFMAVMGNSVITVLTPVVKFLNKVLSALMNFAKMFNSIVSALFGKQAQQQKEVTGTVTEGVGAEKDLAKATEGAGNAAEKAGKQAKGALAGFDELNVLATQSGEAGGEPSDATGSGIGDFDMAELDGDIGEDVEISPKLLESLENLRKMLEPTIEAAERLWAVLQKVGGFVWSGLKDFYDKFLVPVGAWVLSEAGLPRFVNLMADTLSNIDWGRINDSLAELWGELSRLSIFVGQSLIDFYEYFLKPVAEWTFNEAIPRFIDALTNGLSGVDWDNIRQKLQELWEALTPFAINVGEGLLWFWESVLVPLGAWALDNVVPLAIEAIAAVFNILNGIIEALKPLGIWLWEDFLSPIAQWTGGIIVEVLAWIVEKLQAFSDWINENSGLIEDIVVTIGSFTLAWKLVTGALKLWNEAVLVWNGIGAIAATVTSAFSAAVAFLTSPVWLVVTAIGALIAIVVLLAIHWDEVKIAASLAWDRIKEVWEKVSTWFSENVITPVSRFFTGLWDDIKTAASTAWTSITETFATAKTWFTENVITPIKNAFKTGINGMIGFAEGFVNSFIKGINKIVEAINSLSFDLPDALGGGHIGFDLNTVSQIAIPRLATGAVIPPNRQFMAILGDQKHGTNIEAPLETIMDAVRAVMAERGSPNSDGRPIILELNGREIGRTFLPILNNEKNRVGISLKIGGAF